ncbi:MAG: hypothetical protein ACKO6E_10550 [Planctomycetota bacterium]
MPSKPSAVLLPRHREYCTTAAPAPVEGAERTPEETAAFEAQQAEARRQAAAALAQREARMSAAKATDEKTTDGNPE